MEKSNPALKPLDVEEFIHRFNAKPITSDKTFENKKERKLDPKGVYSEEIFGFLGSRQRFERWGYIPIPFKIFAPFAFDRVSDGIIKTFLGKSAFNAAINGEPFYLLNDGSFSSEPEDEKKNLYSIYGFKTIDDLYEFLKQGEKNHEFHILRNYWYEIKKNGKFFDKILQYLNYIFIDKLLVIPAGYRDILIKKDGTVVEDPLSKEYKEIIKNINKYNASKNKQSSVTKSEEDNKEIADINSSDIDIKTLIQQAKDIAIATQNEDTEEGEQNITPQDYKTTVKYLYTHLLNVINGIADILGLGGTNAKYKLIQGGKLAKRLDHAVRLVLEPDKDLPLDMISIPWMFLIKLYEPFVLHYIEKDPNYQDVKEWVLKELTSIGETDEEFKELQNIRTIPKEKFLKLTNTIVTNPKMVPPHIKNKFVEILEKIINGEKDGVTKRVLALRHPVEDAEHLLGLIPVVNDKDVYVTALNPQNFARLGADCSWDEITVHINGKKTITCHIRDLLKYVAHNPIEEFDRPDGVHVKFAHITDDVEILAYDREKGKFVIDKITAWYEHSNIKMNKIILSDGTEFIMSPSKETLVTEDGELIKPIEENIGKCVLHKDGKCEKIVKVEPTDIDIGWDISTLNTGTYVDKYGFVKKQCDGETIIAVVKPV